MPTAAGQDALIVQIPAEDQLRAQVYRLLAVLISSAPDQHALSRCAALAGGPGRFGTSVATLSTVAAGTTPEAVAHEFHDLFVGLGRGEIVPYGSYYLTGFLQEKPLARLRADMARLGIARRADVADPEDHAAAVLEMMAGLIDGTFSAPAGIAEQREFFNRHIGAWMPVMAKDLQRARSAAFYGAVGLVLEEFMKIEEGAFALD